MGFMDWAGTAAQTGLNTYKSLAELEIQKAAAQRAAEQQAMQQQLMQMQIQKATADMERQNRYQGLMSDPSMFMTDAQGNQTLDEKKYMQAALQYMEPDKVPSALAAMKKEPKSLTEMDLSIMAAGEGPQAEFARKVLGIKASSGKPPAGYVRNSEGQLILDPNSAGGLKQQEKLEQGRMALQNTMDSFDMLETKIDKLIDPKKKKALDMATGRTGAMLETGLGKIVGAGTEAYDMKATLDSIKAQVGLDALAALKKASGAGLGSVTEAEHKLLQGYIASLDAAQSADAVIEAAKQIKTFMGKTKANLQTGLQNAEKRVSGASKGFEGIVSDVFGADAPQAMKIMQAESGGKADATQSARNVTKNPDGSQTVDRGLFQINDINVKELMQQGIIRSKEDLLDPETNVRAAKYLKDKYGWSPWNSSKSKWGGAGQQYKTASGVSYTVRKK